MTDCHYIISSQRSHQINLQQQQQIRDNASPQEGFVLSTPRGAAGRGATPSNTGPGWQRARVQARALLLRRQEVVAKNRAHSSANKSPTPSRSVSTGVAGTSCVGYTTLTVRDTRSAISFGTLRVVQAWSISVRCNARPLRRHSVPSQRISAPPASPMRTVRLLSVHVVQVPYAYHGLPHRPQGLTLDQAGAKALPRSPRKFRTRHACAATATAGSIHVGLARGCFLPHPVFLGAVVDSPLSG
jgi:hypothetical protein